MNLQLIMQLKKQRMAKLGKFDRLELTPEGKDFYMQHAQENDPWLEVLRKDLAREQRARQERIERTADKIVKELNKDMAIAGGYWEVSNVH